MPAIVKLQGLQSLRAIAALMVVFVHTHLMLVRQGTHGPYSEIQFGRAGVDIFFVISGFIMVHITKEKLDGKLPFERVVSFWKDRFFRVAPVYWLWTLCLAAIAVIAPALVHVGTVTPEFLAKSLLFIPMYHPSGNGQIWPVLVPGWSLNYEMFFYGLFGLSLLLPARRLLAFAGVLVALVLAGLVFRPTAAPAVVYTDPLLLEFLAGVGLAVLYRRGMTLGQAAGGVLIVAGFALLLAAEMVPEWPRVIRFGIPAVLVVTGVLACEAWLSRFRLMSYLGDASYSIYLTHLFALAIFGAAWRMSGLHPSYLGEQVLVAIAMAVSAIGGVIAYELVERPLSRMGKPRRLRPARS